MTPGDIQEVASTLNVLRPDDDAMALWIGALTSGDYKTGQGVLRSAEDEYDPFGVLAVINHAEWTWSNLDQGWGIGDSAMALDSKTIAKWLDIPSHEQMSAAGLLSRVKDFQDLLLRRSDEGLGLMDVGELLRKGVDRATEERERQRQSRYRPLAHERSIGSESFRDSISTSSYYGKRS